MVWKTEKEKNKFWKGILIGALANSRSLGLIAVTAAAGIWIMGRMTANQLGAASLAGKREPRTAARKGRNLRRLSICLRSGLSLRIWRAL